MNKKSFVFEPMTQEEKERNFKIKFNKINMQVAHSVSTFREPMMGDSSNYLLLNNVSISLRCRHDFCLKDTL